jgi:branched-subunit amino acid transport protein
MIDVFQLLTLLGLAAMTVLTRCFFFILNRELPFPAWAQRGLQYAPIAALAAVVVPEIVVSHGALITTWLDARLFGAAAGAGFYFYKRGKGQAVLGTIIVGMAVYLPLRIGLGW